jgi:Flp pilus assembly protein TadB
VANPDEVDDEGNPVAEGETATESAPAAEPDPAAEAALRRQIDQTLRAMALSTIVGLIAIVVVAVVVPSIRGVMVIVAIVYVGSSLAARWYLRRQFMSRLKRPDAGVG